MIKFSEDFFRSWAVDIWHSYDKEFFSRVSTLNKQKEDARLSIIRDLNTYNNFITIFYQKK